MAISCTSWEFWRAGSGGSRAEKEWDAVTDRARGDFSNLLDRVMAGTLTVDGRTCAKFVGDVFYLRIKHGSNPFRLYYKIRDDKTLVILRVSYKNQQKVPSNEKATILKRAVTGNGAKRL